MINILKKRTTPIMKMELKRNIPQIKVTRDITMVPINIVDPRVLLAFKTPNIINSTVYIREHPDKGYTEVWHNKGDKSWDCVIVSE